MIHDSPTMADPRGYMTEKQIKKFFEAIDNTRDKALFMLLYRCGRRVSEVIRLKYSDIIWKENKIIFGILKKRRTKKELKPVDKETMKALREYIKNPPQFIKKKDKDLIFPISRQFVFKRIRTIGGKAGIGLIGEKRIHPHHLRHSFAVHQVKNNIKTASDLRILQMYMGHTNISATAHYLQFSTDDLKQVSNMWDKGDNRTKK